MDSFATQPADERRAVFVETAARMGAASSVIAEKDFWVCFALHHLFALDFRPSLLFKGGTSLSKAFGLIDRFSEDIDLTLNRAELGFSGSNDPIAISGRNARQRKIDELGAACARVVREQLEPALRASIASILGKRWALELVTLEDGQVDLRFRYPPALSPEDYGGLSYIQPFVRMEIGARSDQDPSQQIRIRSYASEHFPDLFTQRDAEVRVLAPERTFWEKATILHAENHRPLAESGTLPPAWRQLSRHAYDIAMLVRRGVAGRALARKDLLAAVALHKEAFFFAGWAHYDKAVPGSFRLVPSGEFARELRRDYSSLEAMLFGEVPSFDEILRTLSEVEEQINQPREE
jgi:hypothetical protein